MANVDIMRRQRQESLPEIRIIAIKIEVIVLSRLFPRFPPPPLRHPGRAATLRWDGPPAPEGHRATTDSPRGDAGAEKTVFWIYNPELIQAISR